MPDRDEVDQALLEVLMKFGLGPYVDALMDTLDAGVEWDDDGGDE